MITKITTGVSIHLLIRNIYLSSLKIIKCSSNYKSNIISDAEVSIQIEEEEELSTSVSTPVKDIPFVPKSESNEEWIPMDDMNQLQKTGEIYLFCLNHVICPVQMIFKSVKNIAES